MKLSMSIIISLAFSLAGCGQGSTFKPSPYWGPSEPESTETDSIEPLRSTGNSVPPLPIQSIAQPVEPLRSIARPYTEVRPQAQVYCRDPRNCHGAVGMLTVRLGETKTGLCSAFLIEPDLILTNSHCIPTEWKRPKYDCSDKASIHFPRTATLENEVVGCKSILLASTLHTDIREREPNLVETDYALIRLDRPSRRPPLKMISLTSMTAHSPIFVTKVNPMSETEIIGEVETVECRLSYSTISLPYSRGPEAPLWVLSGCPNRQGNSGSPVHSANGEVFGITQAALKRTISPETLEALGIEGGPSQQAIATNLDCLPLDSTTPMRSCRVPMKVSDPRGIESLFNERTPLRIDENSPLGVQLREWRDSRPGLPDSYFKFGLKEIQRSWISGDARKIQAIAFPVCFDRPDLWPESDRSGKVKLEIAASVFEGKERFNQDMQLDLGYQWQKEFGLRTVAVEFDASEIIDDQSKVSVSISLYTNGRTLHLEPVSMGVCSPSISIL